MKTDPYHIGIGNHTITLEDELTAEHKHWKHQAQWWHIQIWQTDFIMSCTAYLKYLMPFIKILILQTTLIKQPKPQDIHIMQHLSEWQTHHISNKASILEDCPGEMAYFTALFPMSIIMMAYMTILTANCLGTIPFGQVKGTIYKVSLLSSVIIQKTIIHAALSLIETSDSTKIKFEAWRESIDNAVLISGQDTLCISFTKMTGSPLSSAHSMTWIAGLLDTGKHSVKQWRIASGIFILLGLGMKGPKAIAQLISIFQKHQQSLRSRPQRNQDHTTDVVDPTSKTIAKTIKVTLVTNSRTHHPLGKTTKETITPKNAMIIGTTVICSPQEPYHSQHPSKLSQVMTFWQV